MGLATNLPCANSKAGDGKVTNYMMQQILIAMRWARQLCSHMQALQDTQRSAAWYGQALHHLTHR
jgi:hypothetical protein